jgi:uroporphyrinogen-III synthase
LAAELADFIGSQNFGGLRILVPTSNIARDVLPRSLSRFGVMVDVVEVYRTEPIRMNFRRASETVSISHR